MIRRAFGGRSCGAVTSFTRSERTLRALDQAIQWYLSGDREFPGEPRILGKLAVATRRALTVTREEASTASRRLDGTVSLACEPTHLSTDCCKHPVAR